MLRRRLTPWAEDSATNLAVLRIATFATLLLSADVFEAAGWIARGSATDVPDVSGALWRVVHQSPLVPPVLQVAIYGGAVLGLVGLAPRAAAAVCAVSTFVLLGAAQAVGATFHCHHLVLFPALLVFAPSADALSLRHPRPNAARQLAYGVPLRGAALLLGTFFLFPAIWKLRAAGFEWASPERLSALLRYKWAESGFVPVFQIDLHPALLHVAGLLVIAVELAILPLVLFRKTRPFVVPLALAFHLGTLLTLDISFTSLWLFYGALIDWDRIGRARPAAQPLSLPSRPGLVIVALLVGGQLLAGCLGAESEWPFACYPTFRDEAPPFVSFLRVETKVDGEWSEVPPPRGPRYSALQRELIRRLRSGDAGGIRSAFAIAPGVPVRAVELSMPVTSEGTRRATVTATYEVP